MTALSDQARVRLAALADQLIPAGPDGLLSASAAGIAGPLLDRALLVDPGLEALFSRMLDAVAEGASIWHLRDVDPALFERVAEAVAAIYFMAPAVREQIGFPGREPVLARIDIVDIEDILVPVLEAGFEPRAVDAV